MSQTTPTPTLSRQQERRMVAYATKQAGLHKWIAQGAPSYDKAGLSQDIYAEFGLTWSDRELVARVVKAATYAHTLRWWRMRLRRESANAGA